jgi:hypothetical protein
MSEQHTQAESLVEAERLAKALRRLHDWVLAQEGDCMFSGDHPIAQAAAALSTYGWFRSDAVLAESKAVIAKFDAIAVMAKDAARYRWLRDHDDCDWNVLMRDGGDVLDDAIDAAIAKATRSDA